MSNDCGPYLINCMDISICVTICCAQRKKSKQTSVKEFMARATEKQLENAVNVRAL